jgi:hypothetical protein
MLMWRILTIGDYTFTFFVNKVLKVLSALRTFFSVNKSVNIKLDSEFKSVYNTFVEVNKV